MAKLLTYRVTPGTTYEWRVFNHGYQVRAGMAPSEEEARIRAFNAMHAYAVYTEVTRSMLSGYLKRAKVDRSKASPTRVRGWHNHSRGFDVSQDYEFWAVTYYTNRGEVLGHQLPHNADGFLRIIDVLTKAQIWHEVIKDDLGFICKVRVKA